MWHLRSLLENNFCCHSPVWGYNSITKVVCPGVGLPKDKRVCPAPSGLLAVELSRDSWSSVSIPPRARCHAVPLPRTSSSRRSGDPCPA